MSEVNFLPSIEVRLTNTKESFLKSHENDDLDIFDAAKINDDGWFNNHFDISKLNLNKLNTYMRMQLKVRFIKNG